MVIHIRRSQSQLSSLESKEYLFLQRKKFRRNKEEFHPLLILKLWDEIQPIPHTEPVLVLGEYLIQLQIDTTICRTKLEVRLVKQKNII